MKASRASGDRGSVLRVTVRAPFSWPQAFATSGLAWTLVVLLNSVAAYSDQLRRGRPAALATLISQFALAYFPWVFLSAFLLALFSRRSEKLNQPSFVGGVFLALFAGFFIPETAYQVALTMWTTNKPWSEFRAQFATWPATYWLVDASLYVLTFVLVYAVVSSGVSRAAHALRLETEAENMALRFELEKQRLQALRGQLEPHFMFNALNAISGLVRGDDKSLALSALQQLSSLLRYALFASGKDFVTLGEEVAFVHDYVRLQTLRFGERLRVHIEDGPPELRAVDCPPLLLQPLVENAIRHDLETHEETSRIDVSVEQEGNRVVLSVRNKRREGTAANPGSGLGLVSTRERLRLLYGGEAEFVTTAADDHFLARVWLPDSRTRAGRAEA